MMRKLLTFFLRQITFISIVLICSQAFAATQTPFVNITSGVSYSTLSNALSALNDNETIEIQISGTYACPALTINKNNITLRGATGISAVLNGDFNGNGYCLKITGNGVTLNNLEIRRALNPIKATSISDLTLTKLRINNANNNGVSADGVTGLSISNITFYQVNNSVFYVTNSSNVTISDVTATSYTTINKCFEISSTTGLTISNAYLGCWNINGYFSQCSAVSINDIDMVYGNYGLNINTCHETLIDGIESENIINAVVAVSSSNNCVIQNGTIQPKSGESVYLVNSSGTTVKNLSMYCTGGSSSGVTASTSPNTVISNCEIKNAGYDGITLTGSTGCTVNNTLICSNRKGIFVTNSSNSATIKNNTIINNLDTGITLSSINVANIRNNIVVNNGKTYWTWGIRCDASSVQNLSLTYNDVWNNRENYLNCTPGTGSFSVDPLLVNGCTDAHLQSGSPCIDTGDPSDSVGNEPSPNGGIINLGNYGGTEDATTTAQIEVTVAEAAARGWINLYCYPWKDVQYDQISGLPTATNTTLPAWCGFWVIVNQDVDIVFPHDPNATIPSAGSVMSKELSNSCYYLISVPLQPVSGDADIIFGDDLGSGLYDGSADQKWRVSKWDTNSEDYSRYTGLGSIPDIIPGRGIWIRHIYDEAKNITVTGSPVNNTSDYAIKLKSSGGETYHMIGNPFSYSIDWRSVKVRTPMTETLPSGKIASTADFNSIETWDLSLSLFTADSVYIDANNKAGIIVSDSDYSYMLNAVDLEPFADSYVRVYLLDPDDQNQSKYSFNYRGPNQNSYEWDIVLSTSMDDTEALLDLGNLSSIPDAYSATLTSPDNTVTNLTGDVRVPVTLLSGVDVIYRFTLTRKEQLSVSSETNPKAFGISGISPNPFNPSTTIEYMTDRPGDVRLSIYNITGQKVAVLAQGNINAGKHRVIWNAADKASGVYFVILETKGNRDVKKMTLVR